MKPLYTLLDSARNQTRRFMRMVAAALHTSSGGRISPNAVTLVGLAAHVPIAVLIATEQFYWAAVLLVVFGLFDTLDGELARLQHRTSNVGMLLDASTDRIKEVFLYTGVAYALIQTATPSVAVWAVLACGMSICVSYVKAKGELAISDQALTPQQKNKAFQDGLLRFEVRMALLVVGLLMPGLLGYICAAIAILSGVTVVQRFKAIAKVIDVQN